ncbi:MAG: energy transducer TonB [Cyclobacteriaceae bacterium]|nr:energy transducer TonB [Cyclobacteriaceae bacterium]MDX5465612.1 energy transducer TonB [Cyclobacteriaceae bacterium]
MRLLFTLALWTLTIFSTFGQEKIRKQKVIFLNQHFYEISGKNLEERAFQKKENTLKSGEKVYWIFDLENRMVEQRKVGYNPTEQFNQEIREEFDENNVLKSQTVKNLDNGRYMTIYLENGEKVGQVTFHGDQTYSLWRKGLDSEQMLNRDEFKPGLDQDQMMSLFAKNLNYPMSARMSRETGTVEIALLISETGELLQTEVANAYQINKKLAKEALRVVKLYQGPFYPALDSEGKPIQAWMYIPVRFRLG